MLQELYQRIVNELSLLFMHNSVDQRNTYTAPNPKTASTAIFLLLDIWSFKN